MDYWYTLLVFFLKLIHFHVCVFEEEINKQFFISFTSSFLYGY